MKKRLQEKHELGNSLSLGSVIRGSFYRGKWSFKPRETAFREYDHLYFEAPLGVSCIRDIRGRYYRDTGYLRKKLLGYRILRSSFRDTGYSPKNLTYQMFDVKRSWITKTSGIAAIDNHVNVSSTHRSLGDIISYDYDSKQQKFTNLSEPP